MGSHTLQLEPHQYQAQNLEVQDPKAWDLPQILAPSFRHPPSFRRNPFGTSIRSVARLFNNILQFQLLDRHSRPKDFHGIKIAHVY
jgi:hypothetical protein